MALTDRASQLSLARTLLINCRNGRGTVTLVASAAGMGKTELLLKIADEASTAGFVSLYAAAARPEQDHFMGVFGQLLQEASLRGPEASGAARDLALRIAESKGQKNPDGTVSREVLDDLSAALLRFSENIPVLICVDDVQYADPASLQCLAHLSRRARRARIMIVLSHSLNVSGMPGNLAELGLLDEPHYRSMRLTPLDESGVRETLVDRLGNPEEGYRLAPACYSLTGGNPALLNALVEDHMARPAGSGGGDMPVAGHLFAQAIERCLHRSDADTLTAARVLAVMGDRGGLRLIANYLGTEEAATRAMTGLAETGLLDGERLRDPAVALAVLAGIPAQDCARLHLDTARVLHEEAADVVSVAEHLVAAAPLHGPWSAPVLMEAADIELSRGAAAQAAAFLDLAYRSAGDDQERAILRVRIASLAWRVNPSSLPRHMAELSIAHANGHLSAREAGRIVRYLLWIGRFDDASTTLRRVLESPDSATAVEMRLLRPWLQATYPSVLASVADHPAAGELLGAEATMTDIDPRRQGAAGLARVLSLGPDQNTLTEADHLLQITRVEDGNDEAISCSLLTLVYSDHNKAADEWGDRLAVEPGVHAFETPRAALNSIRAEIALRKGDLLAARRMAQAAISALSPQGWGVGIGAPMGTLLAALTSMGRYEEAMTLLSQPVPDVMFQTRYGLGYLQARGHYYMATGRHHAALADFMTCGELMGEWGIDRPSVVPWRSNSAEVWLRLGERDRARRLVREELELIGAVRGRSRAIALRVLASTGDLHQRMRPLTEAAHTLHNAGDALQLAQVNRDLSRVYHTLSEPSRARVLARKAWHGAKACQAAPLCRELDPLPTERQGVAGQVSDEAIATLTESERRVAGLAAQGYSNREIADQLFITVSTVEQHLTRIYRKLKVRQRKQLPSSFQVAVANSAC